MTGSDRLRAAADRLDWDASYMQPGDFPELQQERQAKTATATLLRAVAEQGKWLHHQRAELQPNEFVPTILEDNNVSRSWATRFVRNFFNGKC